MIQSDKDPPLDPKNEAVPGTQVVNPIHFARAAQIVKRNLDLAQLSPVDRLAAVKAQMQEEGIQIHIPLQL